MLYTMGQLSALPLSHPCGVCSGVLDEAMPASAIAFLLGTLGCALAPDMNYAEMPRARFRVWRAGLCVRGNMALVSGLFARYANADSRDPPATFTTSHLLGPLVGGVLRGLGWWRVPSGLLVPFTHVVRSLASGLNSRHLGDEALKGRSIACRCCGSPCWRGVCLIAAQGPVKECGNAYRIDCRRHSCSSGSPSASTALQKTNSYPSSVLSAGSPVG